MFKLKSDRGDFEDRSKSIFDTLETIELSHKVKEVQFTDVEQDASDISGDAELNPAGQVEKISIEQIDEFTFKVPSINKYKRQLSENASNNKTKHHKQAPDHVIHPDKWKKYSLEDVDEGLMTQGANYRAAMSFLKETNAENDDFNKQADNLVFNKPIGKNKFSKSKPVYSNIGHDILENLEEEDEGEGVDKMDVNSEILEAEETGKIFKRTNKKRNLRKQDEASDNDEFEINVANTNSDKNDIKDEKDEIDEFDNYEKNDQENEIGVDFEKY